MPAKIRRIHASPSPEVTPKRCETSPSVTGLGLLPANTATLGTAWTTLKAENIPSESPEHEGIVLDILRIQGRGPLTRPARGVYGVDIARTVDGTLWNDLPSLVGDMTNLWVNHSASMSGAHRLNFATFLAKLASTRIAKDKLCQVGLQIFHALFESPQELRTRGKSDEEDLNRDTKQLEVFHLLPAAVAWLKISSHNLLLL